MALVVAEAGSFSAAARRLGLTQSTVSRQIRHLEDQVGHSIFERRGSGVRATDGGQHFIMRLLQLRGLALTTMGEAQEFGLAIEGRLRIGFVGSFAASPAKDILDLLRRQHTRLKIHLTETGAADLVRQVLSHELDCAWIASWRSPDPALIVERLWSESLYLALPSGPSEPRLARWSDLSRQVLLARPEAELDLLFPVLAAAGVTAPQVQIHDCSRESLMALVATGHGAAIMPESFARLRREGVRFVRIAEPEADVAVHVIHRRDRDNPALRRLLAVTREWMRGRKTEPFAPS
ncbi:LysR family transcriptional regulator [Caulobacter sp. KR2-114]|uniref:LysR family transcriptional regulator n=1 Tax=Caulobacter sp. KR2-114 TaxID=3400912 RepID=UPI003BFB9436